MNRRWVQIGLGVGLSAVFLYIALRGVNWGDVSRAMADADYRWLPVMAIVGVYALYVRTQRWQLLLEQAVGKSLAFTPIFSANAIGFMANMLLPLRAGEIARPLLLSRRMSVPLASVFATVVIERLLDLMVLVVFAVWVVSTSDVPPEVRAGMLTAGLLFVAMVVVLIVVHLNRERFLPLLDRVWGILPTRIEQIILDTEHRFLDSLATVGDLGVLLRAVLWSFYVWMIIAVGFALGFLVVDINVPFLAGGVSVATVVALAVAAPAAPGFVGTFQFACKVALEQMRGIDAALTLGYSLTTHATQFVTQVILGLFYLLREGLSLGEIGRMKEDNPEGR